MNKRKPLVIMNWSMRQNTIKEATSFVRKLIELSPKTDGVEKVILPSLGTIYPVSEILKNSSIMFGAQNIAPVEKGELSGEFSIESLIDMNGKFVEIGHWERRTIFHEDHDLVNKKVLLTLSNGLIPILCVGETEKEEDYSKLEENLFLTLFNDLYKVDKDDLANLVIAYTPFWAVGKTKAASFPYISKSISIIRESLERIFGVEAAEKVRILYGGSVSPENTDTMMENSGIDGVLIGRFGSNPERYLEVVEVVNKSIK